MFSRLLTLLQKIYNYVVGFFKRDPDRFIKHLREHAQIMVQGLEALVEFMENPNSSNASRVRKLEKEADEIQRMMIDELNHTFVTPIDREDIMALARNIDDVIDEAWYALNEMDILDVSPNARLLEMAKVLRKGSEELQLSMERIPEHIRVATEHASRAKAYASEMETLYASALSDLFTYDKKKIKAEDIMEILKLRESYRHMYHAARNIEFAASTIADVLVKTF